jgi:hypothetical protein
MLSNFQCGDQALLQSFLIGQPELRNLMRSPLMEQFRQRVIASYHLGPLDEDETRGYIEHRLHRVAWKNDPEFDSSAAHAIFVATGGIPRRINAICNRLMLAGFLGGQHKFTSVEVDAVAAEITGEIGPQAVATPLRDAGSPYSAMDPDRVVNIRRLLKMAERVEKLEHDIAELLALVRAMVVPERVVRRGADAPRRRRKSIVSS